MKLKAIIVDDEKPGIKILKTHIQDYCTHLEIVATCNSAAEARIAITELDPDVLFLDINMPVENGFQLLESLPDRHFLVVFVTAYEQYAIRAIRAHAVDYLMKPIKISDLQETEARLLKIHENQKLNREDKDTYKTSLDALMKNLGAGNKIQKLTLYHSKGFNIVDVDKIVRMESDGNYTLIFLSNKTKLVVTRLLKDFEEVLDNDIFVRIHKSHIINLAYLQQYVFDDVGYAILDNGEKIEISRRKANLLFEKITRLSLDMRKDK